MFIDIVEIIVDKCLEKKKKYNITFEQIAAKSEIPLSTTHSFLRKNAQNPSLVTGGAICKALGVSLDAIFGIEDDEMSADELARIREEAKQNEESLKKSIEEHANNILQHEVTIENNNEIIRRQDLRMKELNKQVEALTDRVAYQKTAIIWLRCLSVGLGTLAGLLAIAIIILLCKIIPAL